MNRLVYVVVRKVYEEVRRLHETVRKVFKREDVVVCRVHDVVSTVECTMCAEQKGARGGLECMWWSEG